MLAVASSCGEFSSTVNMTFYARDAEVDEHFIKPNAGWRPPHALERHQIGWPPLTPADATTHVAPVDDPSLAVS